MQDREGISKGRKGAGGERESMEEVEKEAEK